MNGIEATTGSTKSSPPVPNSLINFKEPKDVSMEKVTDDFAVWKNMVVSGFTYYRILPVINGTHRPPSPTTEALQFQYCKVFRNSSK